MWIFVYDFFNSAQDWFYNTDEGCSLESGKQENVKKKCRQISMDITTTLLTPLVFLLNVGENLKVISFYGKYNSPIFYELKNNHSLCQNQIIQRI